MTETRNDILARIRKVTAGRAAEPAMAVLHPLDDDQQARQSRFRQRLAENAIGLSLLDHPDQVPAAVSHYLQQHGNLHGLALDPRLAGLDWPMRPDWRLGGPRPDDRVAICQAHAGIADTGSLVVLASEQSPSSLSFLTEHQILVLDEQHLFDSLEQTLRQLSACTAHAMHLISGPSSTADIGGHFLRGAHGPRQVQLLLVRQASH